MTDIEGKDELDLLLGEDNILHGIDIKVEKKNSNDITE
jgi:hypothetical protein